jgi:putative hydrolase of the HAD superfamily
MSRHIHAVLFDFGDTLMYPHFPWPPVFEQAGQVLGEYLYTNNINIDRATFSNEFRHSLDLYFTEREHSLIETSSMAVLKKLLAQKGYTNLNPEFLRAALDQYYAITQQNWLLEEDTISALTKLQSNGFHIGMVSNASDSRDVLALVEKFDIKAYFDFILISADYNYRKPHPHMFKLAISNWGCLPDELAMVGDRLDADINGARPLGIYTIWITRRAKQPNSLPTHPDATVQTLSEIPPLLLNLSKT